MSNEESYSESEFFYPKEEEQRNKAIILIK